MTEGDTGGSVAVPADADHPPAAPQGTDRPAADRFEREALPHLEELRRAAWRLTRNPHEAEDLLQETLTRALASFARFRTGTNARAWLHRIMHNTFVSGLRSRGREVHVGDLADVPDDRGALDLGRRAVLAQTPEDHVLRREGGEPVRAALRRVPDRFRAVVLLVDGRGYSYAEAAATLGVPVGTIMSRLHRGRRRLRDRLGPRRRRTGEKGDQRDGAESGTGRAVDTVPRPREHERS